MSDLEKADSPRPVSPRPLRTWDFMETLFVGLMAYGAYGLTSILTVAVLAAGIGADAVYRAQSLGIPGHWSGLALIVASPLVIVVLWVAIRMAGRDFAEYLALNWPSPGELMRALAITAFLLWVEYEALSFFGISESADFFREYVSARQAGGLLIFLIGGCLAGPIMEELVARGFMFRGWSQSFPGPVGAIVLTSVLWAMIHTQYDWFGRFWIFVTGLVLCYFRWRCNSTWLTVMAHSAINIYLFFWMGLYVQAYCPGRCDF
jgi:membrane protease YdiL (CAAX protease family)